MGNLNDNAARDDNQNCTIKGQGYNYFVMPLKYEKNKSELCALFLLPDSMFTFLSFQNSRCNPRVP